MNMNPPPPYEFQFNLETVKRTYDMYQENHPGLTFVIGHPFEDQMFLNAIQYEQKLIGDIFKKHGLEKDLILYPLNQIHATILELASQHDESQMCQQMLSEKELKTSKQGEQIRIDFAVEWIRKTEPFIVELGKGVLSEDHKDQTIRITPNGQIVMKGRAKERELLARIRGEFEEEANIVHKYTRNDDEFFFVIGYLFPDELLNSPALIHDLSTHLMTRRDMIQLSMQVNQVSVIHYQQRTLNAQTCLKERKFSLKTDSKISSLFNEFFN